MRDDTIELIQYRISSKLLNNEREVWVQAPLAGANVASAGLAVFLDGEYYLTRFDAPRTMLSLQRDESLPPMWSIYVAAGDQAVRWPESFCNEYFAAFICDELVPWARARTGTKRMGLLVGVSLTGLSAAHIALSRPGVFSRVLCQSASFWWELGKLSTEVAQWPRSACRFRISVGDEETQTDIDHGSGLFQVDSQLESNRRMRDALLKHGFSVSYSEWPGGHKAESWRRELPADLLALYRR
jgi:enterochelin esterase-like enzyme